MSTLRDMAPASVLLLQLSVVLLSGASPIIKDKKLNAEIKATALELNVNRTDNITAQIRRGDHNRAVEMERVIAATRESDHHDDREHTRLDRSVSGCDDRVLVSDSDVIRSPYCAIGFLEPFGCTAVFIGPRHALTAAHCVYEYDEEKKLYKNLKLWRGRTCNNPGQLMHFVKEHANEGYTTWYPINSAPVNDYALLLLQETSPCYLKYGYKEYLREDSDIEITGYPGDKIPSRVENCGYHSMYYKICGPYTSEQVEGLDLRFRYDCDTRRGNSGSPLMTDDKTVYGVHTYNVTGGFDYGTPITKERYCELTDWMRQDGHIDIIALGTCFFQG